MTDDEELKELLDNAPICFGLEAQGHIPTIRAMLASRKTWTEIGDVIGWYPETAHTHYDRWLERMLRETTDLLKNFMVMAKCVTADAMLNELSKPEWIVESARRTIARVDGPIAETFPK